MSWHLPRVRGGHLTWLIALLVLCVDFYISHSYPILNTYEWSRPGEHVGDLIAAAGVALAFVLTYLSALTGLPSPGRQLLASALRHIRNVDPDLAAIDEDGRIPQEEFRSLQKFTDNACDLEPDNQDVLTAANRFMLIVDLAKPPHIRPRPEPEQLQELGYSRIRAVFLSRIVFKRDAEKKWLLRATILCAIIFTYASGVYCLELLHVMQSSLAMLLGYPLLATIGASFATAMALRMWPHEINEPIIGSLIPPLERAMQREIMDAGKTLDAVVEQARRAAAGRVP